MAQDLLPRTFQADLDRLYRRVIRATLDELPIRADVRAGQFNSMDEFLDNCEKQTSNLLAYEARRSFALTLSALFERQLRVWAHANCREDSKAALERPGPATLLAKIAQRLKVDLRTASVADTIGELHLLANAVRHGAGHSVDKLWEQDRHFWNHLTTEAVEKCKQLGVLSEFMRIIDEDFVRYIRALTRFWGLADREPNAMIDGPY